MAFYGHASAMVVCHRVSLPPAVNRCNM